MRQWCQIAGSTNRPLAGDHRRDTEVVKRKQAVNHQLANAGVAARQAGRLGQQNQAHHRLGHGLTHPHRVRTQQVQLQSLQVGLGNALVGQFAETGIDAIYRRAALGRLVHQVGAGTNAGARAGVQGDLVAGGV